VTGDNRRRNIAEEVARAEESLRAAHALRDLGLYADSISRAYYAVFHVLRALILSRDIEPKTHAGAIHLFNQEFVRTGVVASSHNRLLGGLQRARELADYDAAVTFSADDATAECEAATAFRDEMLALLGREGWLLPPT
jgi:uncharacterized protein (UPF0332 family)